MRCKPINYTDSELSIYLRGLVEESSRTLSSVTAALPQSKSMSTAKKSCSKGRKMGASPCSPSSLMSAPSTANRGGGLLTLLRVDFRARMFRRPGKGWVSAPASVRDYGRSLHASLARCGLHLRSSRTPLCWSLADWTSSLETLPPWGMMLAGVCWGLGTSVLPTRGTASGFWPTPSCWGFSNEGQVAAVCSKAKDYDEAVAMTDNRKVVVQRYMLPTPRKSDAERGGRGDLLQAVRGNRNKHFKMLPTPTASTGGPEPEGKTGRKLVTVIGGKLNPDWTEWLMGWPIGWTALQPLEMDKFRKWLQLHFSCCLKG